MTVHWLTGRLRLFYIGCMAILISLGAGCTDDPGGDLLDEMIPPGVRILRFSTRAAMAASLVVLVLGRSPQSASTSLC